MDSRFDILCCVQLDCPAALERIREDRPITIKDDKGNTSKCIADIVSVGVVTSMQCDRAVLYLYIVSVLCNSLCVCCRLLLPSWIN